MLSRGTHSTWGSTARTAPVGLSTDPRLMYIQRLRERGTKGRLRMMACPAHENHKTTVPGAGGVILRRDMARSIATLNPRTPSVAVKDMPTGPQNPRRKHAKKPHHTVVDLVPRAQRFVTTIVPDSDGNPVKKWCVLWGSAHTAVSSCKR